MTIHDVLDGTPYESYLYSYPHKTSYRPLDPPVPLRTVWAGERRDALFLYLHIPFCEMRCGFCNLFTTARPKDDAVAAYVNALERQTLRVRAAIGDARWARVAIGGGTPTLLDEASLTRVLDLAERTMGADLPNIPMSVETSPETATREKLALLVDRGVDRISIGVQSFFEEESRAVNRPQETAQVRAALEAMRAVGVPTINVDLMYGLPGQTPATWLESLRAALAYRPEELYLYPLYVRPLTTLGKRQDRGWREGGRAFDELRLGMYRLGRDFLRSEGYTQVSMRMFRAAHAPSAAGPVYHCQEDGMVGLGCGARSYTEGVHYATEYAVGARGVQAILADYVQRPAERFDAADYGFVLDAEDRRRRHVVLSLLSEEGLDLDTYARRFAGADAESDLPGVRELVAAGLAVRAARVIRLTDRGVERSDAIGPFLVSPRVRALMDAYELR